MILPIPSRHRKGFTLIELLVAMAITIVLLGVLVYLTGISMDTYRDSRNEVRASRQAKEALETIAKDLESMVMRRDSSSHEWLFAGAETSTLKGPGAGKEIANTCRVIFFTGATDRYEGQIGTTDDKGGDVSAVSYRLVYKDQISGGPPTSEGDYPVFSLYRHLVNPDEAFDILALESLETGTGSVFSDAKDLVAENFLVENIYEFTLTFLIEVKKGNVTHIVRASMKPGGCTEFSIKGNKLEYDGTIDFPATSSLAKADVENGRVVGAEVSISVISDRGLTLIQKLPAARWDEVKSQHMYHYTKTVTTPRP